MKKIFFCLTTLILLLLSFYAMASDNEKIYTLNILDSKGQEFNLMIKGLDRHLYFIVKKGDATMELKYKMINKMTAVGELKGYFKKFNFILVNGHSEDLLLKCRARAPHTMVGRTNAFYIRGESAVFGTKVSIPYQDIKNITINPGK